MTTTPSNGNPPTLATAVGEFRLGDLTSLRDHHELAHQGATLDDLVGYIVTRTVDTDGRVEWHDETRTAVGVDVAVFDGPNLYGQALERAREYRVGKGWAVVASVYACGCRS